MWWGFSLENQNGTKRQAAPEETASETPGSIHNNSKCTTARRGLPLVLLQLKEQRPQYFIAQPVRSTNLQQIVLYYPGLKEGHYKWALYYSKGAAARRCSTCCSITYLGLYNRTVLGRWRGKPPKAQSRSKLKECKLKTSQLKGWMRQSSSTWSTRDLKIAAACSGCMHATLQMHAANREGRTGRGSALE